MNILDKFISLLFCFHTFGVRRTIYVLDSENQPGSGSGKIRTGSGTGSGALVLTGDVWHQKYKNKKEGVRNYLRYSFNRLLKIFLSFRYRAPDPVFGQNRILVPALLPNYQNLNFSHSGSEYTEKNLDFIFAFDNRIWPVRKKNW